MDDLISRQAAIDALNKMKIYRPLDSDRWVISDCLNKIVNLPSVQPPTTGNTISRQAAIDAIRASTKKYTGFMEMEMYTDDDAVEAIEGLPSVQPDIIRCKECKFYSPMNKETKTGICNLIMHQNFGDDWFCAGAERRTDEGN